MSERQICFDDFMDVQDEAEDTRLWDAFVKQLGNMDDAAARAHHAAGRPIYVGSGREDRIVRIWPDGRREAVTVDDNGHIVALADE